MGDFEVLKPCVTLFSLPLCLCKFKKVSLITHWCLTVHSTWQSTLQTNFKESNCNLYYLLDITPLFFSPQGACWARWRGEEAIYMKCVKLVMNIFFKSRENHRDGKIQPKMVEWPVASRSSEAVARIMYWRSHLDDTIFKILPFLRYF